MKVPKTFVNEDHREKLFDEMLEKNRKRPSKLESIEDLVLESIPKEILSEHYRKITEPRYSKKFDEKDRELDYVHFNELEIDFIKTIHTTNFDTGLYKLDLLIIESNNKEELEYYYETILKYEQEVNKGNPHSIVKHLTRDKYLMLFVVNEAQLDIESPLLKKIYTHYKEKFDMKRINVRKVIELI